MSPNGDSGEAKIWAVSGLGWGTGEVALRWDLCFGAVSWEGEPMGRWLCGRRVSYQENRPAWLAKDDGEGRERRERVWVELGIAESELAIVEGETAGGETWMRHWRWLRSRQALSHAEAAAHLRWLKREWKDAEEGNQPLWMEEEWEKKDALMGRFWISEEKTGLIEAFYQEFVQGRTMSLVWGP